ncbi:CHY zinc finger [Musa troglodytarum]|uniref:CHY zinc finger n=1 Tax=Musa troglodytarum TaxID=320322 RepID=A0A9E7E837_9LILI|nr:CHY zinc finger [Musa troglodytarum]
MAMRTPLTTREEEQRFESMYPSSSSSLLERLRSSDGSSPLIFFLFFHKAIRSELDRLHRAAVALATDGVGDVEYVSRRCRFLFCMYQHHSNAEDEVIFPALDKRVKNVSRTYFLEHKGEHDLFKQLFDLLDLNVHNDDIARRELASCTGAIQTSIMQHISKEEEQVFPLLIEKFSLKEQADLVWQFLCSIPVNIMVDFLPWLSSCVSQDEHKDIMTCLCKVVPKERLLQQVIFAWMKGKSFTNQSMSNNDVSWHCIDHSNTRKRKHAESDSNFVDSPRAYPINEILDWHNAIRKEVNDIAKEARQIQLSRDFSDLSTFYSRLEFVADVCIYHSIAEDQILFPAVDMPISFVEDHAEEKNQFSNLRCLIKRIECAGVNSVSPEFYSKLCSHVDRIMVTIQRHFNVEEAQVLPIARISVSPEKQRKILYRCLCVMPLRLIERALPWLVATLCEDEARSFLQNMKLAASSSETALVTLFAGWACKGQLHNFSRSGRFTCLSLKAADGFFQEEKDKIEQNCGQAFCAFASPLRDISAVHTENDKDPVDRCSFPQSCRNNNEVGTLDILDLQKHFSNKQTCFAPGLGLNSNSLPVDSMSKKSEFSLSCNSSAPHINSSLFSWETDIISSNSAHEFRPIDTIFKFHKAIRKDLEYLDMESEKLIGCDDYEAFLRNFSGRFCLLWGLYKAHSNAEDRIVFPALESRETLHNVSHSYILDHKQEEKLFSDISAVLTELSQLCDTNNKTYKMANTTGSDCSYSVHDICWTRKHNALATKLQSMCRSIRVTLDQHVFMEELELWPLFDSYFSFEEQDKIVGSIIGMTGAEILQSMLPWVTSALTEEEHDKMMETWKEATKNTMFNEWLNEWWGERPVSSHDPEEANVLPKGMEQQENLDQIDQTFKPGWNDIFRMNQNELESEIRKVSRDPTLDPRRKAYLIQNLMTSCWLAGQQKLPHASTSEDKNGDVPGCSPSYRDLEQQIFGCEHYKRNCKILAACCKKLFTCRFCHDSISDHTMDRKAVMEMMCMRCLKVQTIGPTCKTDTCNGFPMAKYFCKFCKFFDDERTVYHCPFCNLCRLGKGLGIDFFHCMKCNCCLGMKLVDHKCREKGLESNCPICCDFLFTSSMPVRALPCGHFMHSACFQAYASSHYTCPICSKSLGDMTVYFGMLDALLASEQLPEEYGDRCQDILCNDCDKKGLSRFHWLYHKCSFCGSYNTRVIKNEANSCLTSSN